MPNKIIIFCETINEWIEPRCDEYLMLCGEPEREGDETKILVNGKVIRVMLCKVKNTVKPGWWLVERKRG